MKTQNNYMTRFLLMVLFLLLSFVIPRLAIAQQPTNTVSTAALSGPESKHISSIRSQVTPNGSRVILTLSESLADYGAYRNGDKFTVLLPGTDLSLTEINVKGAGFTSSKVESRGNNLSLSFQLEANVNASVSQVDNRLEVSFSRPLKNGGLADVETSKTNDEPERPTSTPEVANPSTSRASAPLPAAPRSEASAIPLIEATGTDADNISQREVDLSVPESPAFTVLGVTPETVTRPTTPREFATSLLNGVDQRGNFQTGLALDFVPFLTFFGDQTSLFSYKRSRLERFLARTQLSFATTKGATTEDKSARLALGVRLTLLDKGDPRLDEELNNCYRDALNDPRLDDFDTPPNAEAPEVKARRLASREKILAEVVKPCNDEARKRNWNGTGWIVGAAPSWISETGETKNFHWNGGGFWTSLAYGFEGVSALQDNSQLILHARYRNNEIVPDTANAGQFLSQDSYFFGGRLRIAPGSGAKSIFSVEGNYIRSRLNKGLYDNSTRFSLGLEQRIADGIWFSLALGGQGGRADGENKPFVLTSFKWGFDKKR
ncbi:MAG TPA: hypothetical protein VJU86_17690 [Pyrinomonadaceae bacterium]|nr:hypothetical protein [Pyrinomonadaceae bacterium]